MKKRKRNIHQLLVQNGYAGHGQFGQVARFAVELSKQEISDSDILEAIQKQFGTREKIREKSIDIKYFGESFDSAVYDQIKLAGRLPVTEKACVLPDGHPGYALPIGGVVGLNNAISPAFVGYDIGCRVHMSILDLSPIELETNKESIAKDMKDVSSFGIGVSFDRVRKHSVMEDEHWDMIKTAKHLKPKAHQQLGTSGGGNHFFDALMGEVIEESIHLPSLKCGDKFTCIMTHSGSRGTGHKLATYYTKLAEKETKHVADVPRGYGWLSMNSDSGKEYWEVMQLMGKYAQANHQLIHYHFSKKSKIDRIVEFENHHNFAWLENNLYVHRKGATPAHKGQVGIIPGSMGTHSYLVEGLGNPDSLNSSSHGAGRVSSRRVAKERLKRNEYQNHIEKYRIKTIGVADDETYQAYKDIDKVIAIQDGILIKVLAKLFPVIVIMGGKADDGD